MRLKVQENLATTLPRGLKSSQEFYGRYFFYQDDTEIAATIIQMGHILSFKVLAEGLESTGQRGILRGKDHDNYQGPIISKPVPAVEFAGTLQEAS